MKIGYLSLSPIVLLLTGFSMLSSSLIARPIPPETEKTFTTNRDSLPDASFKSLTQIYSDSSLQNREVTFRDERLLTSRGIETVYQMPVYHSQKEWEERKEYLKQHILVMAGLWPLPEKTDLHPAYYHRVEHDDYIVETVTIQPFPGFFLGGNIYSPKGKGPFPAVLCPHGHFEYGRLTNDQITSIPGRCINFAKQGYVAFSYDMVGYEDTKQVSHTFADDDTSRLYGINLLGLQLWNSIRALDFLCSLPAVDTSRIAITGASGGGTQTFLLTAVDNRFKVTAPVNMVSNTMQGGDLCENAPGLRVNTFNAEIAAMVAPKPMILVSDTYDWTFNTRNTIMPMVRSIYDLFGNTETHLENRHFDFQHNYNKASRDAVYAWFGKWLQPQRPVTEFVERPFQMDPDSLLLAFLKRKSSDRNMTFSKMSPADYQSIPNKMGEDGLKQLMKDIYKKQLEKNWPRDAKSLRQFKSDYGISVLHLLEIIRPRKVEYRIMGESRGDNFIAVQLLVSEKDKNNWIPCIWYRPLTQSRSTVILTADKGKSHWVSRGSSAPDEAVMKLLKNGYNVLTPDLFKQGEHVLQDSTKSQRKENDRFFTTYNRTDRQNQIQDLIDIVKMMKQEGDFHSDRVHLLATGNTGMTGLLLATVATDINSFIVDGDQINPESDREMMQLQIPGLMRIGGLKTILALTASKRLTLYNAHQHVTSIGLKEIAKLETDPHFVITTKDASAASFADQLKQP